MVGSHDADLMPAFFALLRSDPEPAACVAPGPLMFVFIHPCADGNGWSGHFLLNVRMAAGGCPCTVEPLGARAEYVLALAASSVERRARHHFVCAMRLHSCQ